MQASKNEIMGDEIDESAPFEGDELDGSASFEGDELDDLLPDEAGEPQGSTSEDRPEALAADNREGDQVIIVEIAPGRKKKIIFSMLAGLCALTVGATLYGTVLAPKKNAAPGAIPVVMKTDAPLDFESFVIPFHQENSHYVSFSISFRAAEKAVLAELRQKKEIFRGRIYDLLEAYAARRTGPLSPGVIKEIVADSVNAWLSVGSVDGVYITHFIVI